VTLEELGGRFPMFQMFRTNTEGECLHPSDRFVSILAMSHVSGQGRDLREQAAILFSLNFNRKRHAGNVRFGPAVQ
jgi:hypothetical protein